MLSPRTFFGRTAWSFVLVFGLGFAACETPLESEVEVGQRIQLTQSFGDAADPADARASAEYVAAQLTQLASVDRVEIGLEDLADGTSSIELFLVGSALSKQEIHRVLQKTQGELHLHSVMETVTGEIHEKLRHRIQRTIFGHELDGKSAEEIHEQLQVHLEEFGIDVDDIHRSDIHENASGEDYSVFEIHEDGADEGETTILELNHAQEN